MLDVKNCNLLVEWVEGILVKTDRISRRLILECGTYQAVRNQTEMYNIQCYILIIFTGLQFIIQVSGASQHIEGETRWHFADHIFNAFSFMIVVLVISDAKTLVWRHSTA